MAGVMSSMLSGRKQPLSPSFMGVITSDFDDNVKWY
jgi:hypothetical protein